MGAEASIPPRAQSERKLAAGSKRQKPKPQITRKQCSAWLQHPGSGQAGEERGAAARQKASTGSQAPFTHWAVAGPSLRRAPTGERMGARTARASLSLFLESGLASGILFFAFQTASSPRPVNRL